VAKYKLKDSSTLITAILFELYDTKIIMILMTYGMIRLRGVQ